MFRYLAICIVILWGGCKSEPTRTLEVNTSERDVVKQEKNQVKAGERSNGGKIDAAKQPLPEVETRSTNEVVENQSSRDNLDDRQRLETQTANSGPTTVRVSISTRDPSDRVASSLRSKLESLLKQYKLDDYIFKPNVVITNTPSFSGGLGPDPIELSTYLENKGQAAILMTFLHEEAHISNKDSQDAWDEAIASFRNLLANLRPETPAEIGRGDDAMYLHVAVNWLELQAGKRFLGADQAYRTFCSNEIYPTINSAVVANEARIAEVMSRLGLALEPWSETDLDRTCN